MRIDPLLRLVALNAPDRETARNILCGDAQVPEGLQSKKPIDPIEDAVAALVELVEEAICLGHDELTIDTSLAEFVLVALKNRKLSVGRPKMTPRQKQVRKATISFARKRSIELRAEGLRPGKADRRAAEEAAELGGRCGDVASSSTILQEMKPRLKK